VRRLIAALACRLQGTRLYGKPVQNLVEGKRILDQILDTIEQLPSIEKAVLGISEGNENQVFVDVARSRNIPYIIGDQEDVLSRLISCGRQADATDVFRITTECPFLHAEPVEEAWNRHLDHGNDVTTTDGLPEGTHFEIYTLKSLELSHEWGTDCHREGCSRYVREHREEFQVEVMMPPDELVRMDLRLTVDYPEDLVLCRRVYEEFQEQAPLIPLVEIIEFLDANPELKRLVEPYVVQKRLWPDLDNE